MALSELEKLATKVTKLEDDLVAARADDSASEKDIRTAKDKLNKARVAHRTLRGPGRVSIGGN